MRVLHLISSVGFFGAENVLIQLAKELRQTEFTPVVGVIKNLYNPHLEILEEAKRHNLPFAVFPCNSKLDPKTFFLIRSFLEKEKISIIHTHGYKSNFYALAAGFGKNVRRVTTCHNWLGDVPKMRFYARLDKFLLNRFDRVIAVSDTVKQEILESNISPLKVLRIFNGVDIHRFNNKGKADNIKRELGIDERYKIVGTVGRLSEEKGHLHLLDAAKEVLRKYPKVVFLIVGDGPMRQVLKGKCSKLAEVEYTERAFSKTTFVFAGIRNDMPAIYSLMDVFILPSIKEGLPMVLLEAMASQKPVVATHVGAMPTVIEHGISGLLIQPRDAKGLAEAIIALLKKPEKADQLARNGRMRVEQEFSSKKMAERYAEVYQDLVSTSLPKKERRIGIGPLSV